MRAAVSDPYPDKLHGGTWSRGEVKEVLIFTDENQLVFSSVSTNLKVRGLGEPQVEDMQALRTPLRQKP